MKAKSDVEMERYALSVRLRAEAHIIRARWLNEVMPAVLEEFDRRLNGGESVVLELPSADVLIEAALEQVSGSST